MEVYSKSAKKMSKETGLSVSRCVEYLQRFSGDYDRARDYIVISRSNDEDKVITFDSKLVDIVKGMNK